MTNEYQPSQYIPHPGLSLKDWIDESGIVQKDLCEQINFSEKHLSQIIHGKAPISAILAIKLSRYSGISASFWNNLQANYNLRMAEQELDESITKIEKFLLI